MLDSKELHEELKTRLKGLKSLQEQDEEHKKKNNSIDVSFTKGRLKNYHFLLTERA